MKNKNKAVVKDEFGYRWFVTKQGKVFPTNWKLQATLEASYARAQSIQEQLYGKKDN